jgi:hypothetical protein
MTAATTHNTADTAVTANKELAVRFLELVAAHDIDALCALVTPAWTMTGGPPGLPAGPEGIRILFGTFGKIEQEWAVQDVIAEGDRVVVRAVNTCEQESFLGVPSNGRTQVFTATFVHRVAGTPDRPLIDQTWRNADDLGRLLQLGAKIVAE